MFQNTWRTNEQPRMGMSLSLPPVERSLVGGKELGDTDPGGRASSRKLHWLPAIQPKEGRVDWVWSRFIPGGWPFCLWPAKVWLLCGHSADIVYNFKEASFADYFFKGEGLFYKFGFKVRLVDILIASFSNLHNLNSQERLLHWLILVSFIRKQNCVFPELVIRSV